MSLLDTIHAFYIKALAKLPSTGLNRRILRALLMAGHCYGPLDAVTNIILSALWYDIAFPPARGKEDKLPQGVLSTKHMSRLGSCSLNGMVAILRATFNYSDQEAFIYLKQNDCNLSHLKDTSNSGLPSTAANAHNIPFAAATEAANHPQHAAFASFLMSLSTLMCTALHSFFSTQPADRMFNAYWAELKTFLRDEACVSSVQMDVDAGPSTESLFEFQGRTWHAPPGFPSPHQVTRPFSSPFSSKVEAPFSLMVKAPFSSMVKPPSSSQPSQGMCPCPAPEMPPFSRCTICETKGSRIVHPPAGGHLGDIKGFVDLGQDRVPHAYNVGSKALREADILYEDEMPETMPHPPIRWSGLPEVQAGRHSPVWRKICGLWTWMTKSAYCASNNHIIFNEKGVHVF
ncbi:hypothetical protein EJB05_23730, partial [Eragrostis curvula]